MRITELIKSIGLVLVAGMLLGVAQPSAHARNCLSLKPLFKTRTLESCKIFEGEFLKFPYFKISDRLLSGYSGEKIKDDYFLAKGEGGSTGNSHVRWSLELFLGSALNIPTPLSIHQFGEERIFLYARYNENPFKGSPYYAWRIAKWNKSRAWEFELVHHKLYLANKPPEIQHFEISHGYNLLTLNRAWERTNGLILRVGGGVVVTHPETTIRGKKLPWGEGLDGFYLSGSTVQAAIAKKFPIFHSSFATVEGKFTASYAHIPIQDGSAYVPNIAFHGVLGFGFEF